ncbi:hypothetical protein EV356DRAFT_505603 [Viridothelium virens]|uniref:N-acetyltransferase domain-containing protein n=1 Tax=Viridothelium virens TaxID=1048519 RepID=A0A6A6H3D5_VIRVR|nr:hypothetical protein EV356DRAFT_505603 [Viridothelium virens]
MDEPSGAPVTHKSPQKPPPGTRLIPMDLEREDERTILHDQRLICGWAINKIPKWRQSIAKGDRTLFWIALPLSHKTDQTPTLHHSPVEGDAEEILPVGHIALDRIDDPEDGVAPDPTLVSGDGSVLTISALFVLPAFQSFGLGAFAMDGLEAMARTERYGSVKCRAVTVNTLSKRYLEGPEDDPDGRGRWKRLGETPPKRDNALWYARRGYVPYKEEVRYWSDLPNGERLGWVGVFMRKELDGADAIC